MSVTVLVVEDNPLNMQLVTDLLETCGYVVQSANTAEEGIRLAVASPPDLILMDINLPDMDGLQATAILKNDPTVANIPVVALTAHAMKGDAVKAMEAGCCAYIAKPLNTREFPSLVAKYLRSGRCAQQC